MFCVLIETFLPLTASWQPTSVIGWHYGCGTNKTNRPKTMSVDQRYTVLFWYLQVICSDMYETTNKLIMWISFDMHKFWLKQAFQTHWIEWDLNSQTLFFPGNISTTELSNDIITSITFSSIYCIVLYCIHRCTRY